MNCHADRDDLTIRIENIVVIVQDIVEPNPVQKMKAVVVAFLAIESQPAQWKYSIRINHGVMVNADETINQH